MDSLKKITDKKILYIFTLCILLGTPFLKQVSFYLEKIGVISTYNSINAAYVLYFSIPILIYVYIKKIIKTKRKLNVYDYLFYALVLSGIIASLFSINVEISFFGKTYRQEGFLSLLSYYLLFITWKVEGKKEDINRFINIFTIIAVVNSIYALFQIYTPFKFILRYGLDIQMASGLCGNPNFFGSLIVTVLGLITAKFLIDKNISIKNILIVILLFIGLINSESTGPFITYIIVILFLIIYLCIKNKLCLKRIVLLIFILIVTYISIFYMNKEIFDIKKCEMCDFAGNIVNKEQINDYTISNGRIDIWKNSFNIVKKNLINGVGYDNFYLAYYEGINLYEVTFVSIDGQIKATRKYSTIVDNAHNVYLHTLVSSGILGLIPYLALCLITFIKGLRTKDDLIIVLFSGFLAYSIQAFGNISVIQVAPIYYVIIGLILSSK